MKKSMSEVGVTPDLIQLYFRDIGSYQPLSHAEETKLIRQARQGNVQALQGLISANLRFVVRVAREYLNRGLSLGELVSEGNLGLMEATRRFDETRGCQVYYLCGLADPANHAPGACSGWPVDGNTGQSVPRPKGYG